jgi:hypothetical protein
MAFRDGDEVVCVDAKPRAPGSRLFICEGSEYTIRRCPQPGCCGVLVNEAPPPESVALTACYAANRFRKAERKSDSLSIEAFLTIKPGFEEPKRTTAPAKKERV